MSERTADRLRRALCVLLALLPALACASNENAGVAKHAPMGRVAGGMAMSADAAFASPAMSPSPDGGSVTDPARMIVRSGAIDVLVPDPAASVRDLSARVVQLGGMVDDTNESEDGIHLSVRVPSAQLDPFLDGVAALGEVRSRSVSSQDMTEMYSDLRAEIDSLVALRDRLRTLLDRAKTVEDVLGVERELTRVQTRLDMLMRQTKRIETDVALSRVGIYLAKKPERRVLGPLGLTWEGLSWVGKKLWVISP